MIGALSTLWLGDKYGRRKLIWWGSAVMIIGAIIQTASYHLEQLIIARIISGIGNGWITATVPVWQSECARAEHRGYLVMIEGEWQSLSVVRTTRGDAHPDHWSL